MIPGNGGAQTGVRLLARHAAAILRADGRCGHAVRREGRRATASALPFPADQVAKAAAMTSDALQSLAQSYAPMLQSAGAPGLLAQWAAAMPGFA